MGRIAIDFELANYADILQHRDGKLPAERIRRLSMQGVVDPGPHAWYCPKEWLRN